MNIAQRTVFAVGLVAGLLLSGIFTSTALADMSEVCDQFTVASQKQSCENGYNGRDCDSEPQFISACEDGRDQAIQDGVLSGGNGSGNGNTNGNGNSSTNPNINTNNDGSAPTGEDECGGAKTEILTCDEEAGLGAIASMIQTALIVVTILIGIVATGGIVYAAILYASARDNKGQVEQAITIIRNVVIGLFLYGFSIVLINWLIPGGVIG